MWATQVGPNEAVSNLSEWARKCGIKDPPAWLRERRTDRRVRAVAIIGLVFLVFLGGMRFHIWMLEGGTSAKIEPSANDSLWIKQVSEDRPLLTLDNDGLMLDAIFTRNGTVGGIFVDLLIENDGRAWGRNWRKQPRAQIGEARSFISNSGLRLTVATYSTEPRSMDLFWADKNQREKFTVRQVVRGDVLLFSSDNN